MGIVRGGGCGVQIQTNPPPSTCIYTIDIFLFNNNTGNRTLSNNYYLETPRKHYF